MTKEAAKNPHVLSLQCSQLSFFLIRTEMGVNKTKQFILVSVCLFFPQEKKSRSSFPAKVTSTPAVFVFATNINATSLPTDLFYVVKNEIPSRRRQKSNLNNRYFSCKLAGGNILI